MPDAFRLQDRDRAVDRVAFADAAEIELDAVGAQANAIGRAGLDLLVADAPPRLGDLGGGRLAPFRLRRPSMS